MFRGEKNIVRFVEMRFEEGGGSRGECGSMNVIMTLMVSTSAAAAAVVVVVVVVGGVGV